MTRKASTCEKDIVVTLYQDDQKCLITGHGQITTLPSIGFMVKLSNCHFLIYALQSDKPVTKLPIKGYNTENDCKVQRVDSEFLPIVRNCLSIFTDLNQLSDSDSEWSTEDLIYSISEAMEKDISKLLNFEDNTS